MKINENSQLLNTLSNNTKQVKNLEFSDILNNNLKILKEQEIATQEVENFKKDLTKYGAFAFLAKLNEDKIEAKVAQKKAELIEILGVNDPAKAAQKEELTKIIEDMLAEYKKELLARNQSNTLLERSQNLAASKNSGISLASLLSEIS